MASATWAAVTIKREVRNQAVPRMPKIEDAADLSASLNSLVMLTVDATRVSGSMQAASTPNDAPMTNAIATSPRRIAPSPIAPTDTLGWPIERHPDVTLSARRPRAVINVHQWRAFLLAGWIGPAKPTLDA